MAEIGTDMQKINILGIGLTDYPLKESLALLDGYVRNGSLDTILYVTTPMLIMAGKDEEEKKCIESMDRLYAGMRISFVWQGLIRPEGYMKWKTGFL